MVEVRNATGDRNTSIKLRRRILSLLLYSIDSQVEFQLAALSGKLFGAGGDLDGRRTAPRFEGAD